MEPGGGGELDELTLRQAQDDSLLLRVLCAFLRVLCEPFGCAVKWFTKHTKEFTKDTKEIYNETKLNRITESTRE